MRDDWRLTNQESYLAGAVFVRRAYRKLREDWDHDHCEFCWLKFEEEGNSPTPDARSVGYVGGPESQAKYYWVCDECFEDFRERFNWRIG